MLLEMLKVFFPSVHVRACVRVRTRVICVRARACGSVCVALLLEHLTSREGGGASAVAQGLVRVNYRARKGTWVPGETRSTWSREPSLILHFCILPQYLCLSTLLSPKPRGGTISRESASTSQKKLLLHNTACTDALTGPYNAAENRLS